MPTLIMMRRNIAKSEVVLLVLPCVVLAGTAIILKQKRPARFSPPDGRFHLLVNRTAFVRRPQVRRGPLIAGTPRKPARAPRKEEDMLTVIAFVDYEGTPPKWWVNDTMRRPFMSLENVIFTDKQNKQIRYPCFRSGTGHDWKRRYDIYMNCYVPKAQQLDGNTITATAVIRGVGYIRFSSPIQEIKDEDLNISDPKTTPGIQIVERS